MARASDPSPAGSSSLVGPVALLVFLSGTASLGLEMVWSRLLKLVFGSTTLAVTTILVAYMLGLGLGGLWGGRVARRWKNGVRAYGWLELGVGLYALCVPALLARYPTLHRHLADFDYWPAALVRFGVVLAVLVVPTLAMGATLPILVAALVRDGRVVAGRVGLLYGVNTLGAVCGVLAATFFGFGRLGLSGTNLAAALLDIAVGGIAIAWLGRTRPSASEPEEAPPKRRGRWGWIPITYGLVGCTALAYEVAWIRGLAMILGSSTYAFATILAGFLAGIALGSLLARGRLDRIADPRRAYAFGLLALGLSALVVAWSFRALPELFLRAFASVGIAGTTLVWLGLGVAFVVMLAPTLVLGALFPLVVRIVAQDAGGRSRADVEADIGGAVGRVYFANTVGSALGAFAAGFLAIPSLGLPRVLALAIALDFAAAAFVFATHRKEGAPRGGPWALLCVAAAVLVLLRPPAWDAEALASGVYYRTSVQLDFGLPEEPFVGRSNEDELLFYQEGVNCTVSVHRMAGGLAEGGVSMRVNGKTDASLADMSTQVLSGHIPFVFGGSAGPTLVIGYASGITAGAARLHTDHVDVCEIEPAILEASRFFDDYNHRPLERDGVQLIVDDGRSYLATVEGAYDVIVSEPSNPWIAGCANLFTSEFFGIADRALVPGGRLLQWIQLYGLDPRGLRAVLAALHEHFDYAYGFLFDAGSNDLLLVATDEPLEQGDLVDFEALPVEVRQDLRRVRITSTADLWSLARIGPQELRRLADEATVVNTDDSMLVELNAPWTLYDETEETLELVRGAGGGFASFGSFELDDEARGSLASSYLLRRAELELADSERARMDLGAFADLYDGLRQIELGEGDGQRILATLRKAALLRPDAFLPAFHHGRLLGEARLYEQSLRELERALKLRPDDLEAQHERSKSLAALQRNREAYDVLATLLESPLEETEPRLWAEAAFFSGGFGRFDEAIERMEHYLTLVPESPDEWELLSVWHERAGHAAQARDARQNVEVARRRLLRELHWVARWHERFGTKREALVALREVVRRDPENEAAAADLQRLQRLQPLQPLQPLKQGR